ncbi:MAG: hypothetical protein HOW71_12990 [Nonomuraea sp.]|nr:hypothetical protein [Nonomuraea sp.]NUP63074.1 hypothetical protein [Nonomuraea sp.]NUS03437.1 hypothetical protein [Nonomuraea sp.]NUT44193.1 hypothetical protein [Thermoactinospora sp.]
MPTLAKTLAATGVTALCLTATPVPAHAATTISCKVSGQAQYMPGAQRLLQPDLVMQQRRVWNCVDRGNLGVATARLTANFTGVDLSCGARNFSTATGWVTIVWTIRGVEQTSKAQVAITEVAGNTAKVSGTVKSGQFLGRPFTGRFDTTLFGGTGTCISGSGIGNSITTTFKGDFSVG